MLYYNGMLSFNLHPATVHFPIAWLIMSSVMGLLYLYWHEQAELRNLTWTTMYIGWIAGLVAVITGLLDQANLPPRPPYEKVLNWHIGTGLAVLLVYGILIYQKWIYRPKDKNILDEPSARGWLTLLLILGIYLLVLSSWHGGQLVYGWGVNVRQ